MPIECWDSIPVTSNAPQNALRNAHGVIALTFLTTSGRHKPVPSRIAVGNHNHSVAKLVEVSPAAIPGTAAVLNFGEGVAKLSGTRAF
jgi:hypothetical protein